MLASIAKRSIGERERKAEKKNCICNDYYLFYFIAFFFSVFWFFPFFSCCFWNIFSMYVYLFQIFDPKRSTKLIFCTHFFFFTSLCQLLVLFERHIHIFLYFHFFLNTYHNERWKKSFSVPLSFFFCTLQFSVCSTVDMWKNNQDGVFYYAIFLFSATSILFYLFFFFVLSAYHFQFELFFFFFIHRCVHVLKW